VTPEERIAVCQKWAESQPHPLDIANFLTGAFGYDTRSFWEKGSSKPCAPEDTVYAMTNACIEYTASGDTHPSLSKLGWFIGLGLLRPGYDAVSATKLVHRIADLYADESSPDAFTEAIAAHGDGELEAYFAWVDGLDVEYARILIPPLGRKNEWTNSNRYSYRG
jgi:hypothetical protein